MSYWNDSDIDAMLKGLGGVPVTHGTETGTGVIDSIDEHVLAGAGSAQISNHILLRVRTTAFPTMKNGDPIVADGVNYKVVDRKKEGDGAVTVLILMKA